MHGEFCQSGNWKALYMFFFAGSDDVEARLANQTKEEDEY
jgi:hypothetical protein